MMDTQYAALRPISWHLQAPEYLRVRLRGAVVEEAAEPSPWSRTYDCRIEERGPDRCVWNLEFSPDYEASWRRLEVGAVRGEDHCLNWHVSLSGQLAGPSWSGADSETQWELRLGADFEPSEAISGVVWSEFLELKPAPVLRQPRHYFLAPNPDEEELEALVSSSGPPPTCDPQHVAFCRPSFPPDTKLLCCVPDITKVCGCDKCPCGTRKVQPIKVPKPNVGACTGCFSWVCPTS